jgi:hypothetical protein
VTEERVELAHSDPRYLEVIAVAHPEVGFRRYREAGETFVVTVETKADPRQEALEQVLIRVPDMR